MSVWIPPILNCCWLPVSSIDLGRCLSACCQSSSNSLGWFLRFLWLSERTCILPLLAGVLLTCRTSGLRWSVGFLVYNAIQALYILVGPLFSCHICQWKWAAGVHSSSSGAVCLFLSFCYIYLVRFKKYIYVCNFAIFCSGLSSYHYEIFLIKNSILYLICIYVIVFKFKKWEFYT